MLRTLPIQNWFTFHSTITNTEVVIFLTKLVVLKNVDLRPVWYYYLCKVRRERVKDSVPPNNRVRSQRHTPSLKGNQNGADVIPSRHVPA